MIWECDNCGSHRVSVAEAGIKLCEECVDIREDLMRRVYKERELEAKEHFPLTRRARLDEDQVVAAKSR